MRPIYAPIIVASFACPPLFLFVLADLFIRWLDEVAEGLNSHENRIHYHTDW